MTGVIEDLEMELFCIIQVDPNCNPNGLYSREVKGKLPHRRGGDNVTTEAETRDPSINQGVLIATKRWKCVSLGLQRACCLADNSNLVPWN